MTTTKRSTLAPDECRFLIQPQGDAAVVQIGRIVYLVKSGRGVGGEWYWCFHKKDGEKRTVHTKGYETMTCDCPDQNYRRHECKHRRTVRALYLANEANY